MTYDIQFTCAICGKYSLKYNAIESTALEAVVSIEKWRRTENGVLCLSCSGFELGPKKSKLVVLPPVPMEPITVTLPVPPSANRYWRVYRGQVVVSSEAREYKKTVKALTTGIVPLTGLVSLTIHWYRAIAKGDLGNREKVLSDSLQGIAFLDDAQISEIHLYRHDTDKRNPRCEVTVTQLAPAAVSKKRKVA